MKGVHAILQYQGPICIGVFLVGDELTMRVVEMGDNSVTGQPAGVMVEYLHAHCGRETGRK